jgi:hypothetical protein
MKMKSPLSPSDIEVLLHCHTTPGPHPRLDAPAVQEALRMFRGCAMIEVVEPKFTPGGGSAFNTTPKGDAFVKALCNTPEPVQTWTVPSTPEGE